MSLKKKIEKDTLALAQNIFDGPMAVEPINLAEEWDSKLQRKIASSSLWIQLELSDLEIITDEDGEVAGFIDHAFWEGCQFTAHTNEVLLSWGQEAGWLPKNCKAVNACYAGKKGETVLDLEIQKESKTHDYVAGFNTATQKLIYLVPAGLHVYG